MTIKASAYRAAMGAAEFSRPRNVTWLIASLLLAGAAASACASAGASSPAASPGPSSRSDGSGGLASVTLHVGDRQLGPLQALLTTAGLIGKLPFRVDWSDFTSGPTMLQAISSGSVDIGSVGDAPPVSPPREAARSRSSAHCRPIRSAPRSWCHRTRRSARSRSCARKRIAVTQASSANYHLLAVLTKAKLAIRYVTPDYLQPPDAEAAFSARSGQRLGCLVPVHRASRGLPSRQGAGQRRGHRHDVLLRRRLSRRPRRPGHRPQPSAST